MGYCTGGVGYCNVGYCTGGVGYCTGGMGYCNVGYYGVFIGNVSIIY